MIYFDNSATTKTSDLAKKAVIDVLDNFWGNPSSLYEIGIDAEKIIKKAKVTISDIIMCREDEVFFTSGGTESNNLAIYGVLERYRGKNKNIITTSVEHKSVLDVFKSLENDFNVKYVKPNKDGLINIDEIKELIDDNTILVSVMHINNETGIIFDIESISKAVKSVNKNTIVHIDGVQAFCKYKVNLSNTDIDLYSFSGHKIFAPKGIGGLYIKKGTNITAQIVGGSQQDKKRAGTENTAYINALGVCSQHYFMNRDTYFKKVTELKNYLYSKLSDIDGVEVGKFLYQSPYIVNLWVKNIKSEILLHFLEDKFIYVSSGSACNKGVVSYVLKEIYNDKKRVDESIRVSFSHNNTFDEVDSLIESITMAMKVLKRAR